VDCASSTSFSFFSEKRKAGVEVEREKGLPLLASRQRYTQSDYFLFIKRIKHIILSYILLLT
jgi:hypothetical protein